MVPPRFQSLRDFSRFVSVGLKVEGATFVRDVALSPVAAVISKSWQVRSAGEFVTCRCVSAFHAAAFCMPENHKTKLLIRLRVCFPCHGVWHD